MTEEDIHSSTTSSTSSKRTCRVLVVGASRPRIAKVMSLLLPMNNTNKDKSPNIHVEFVPCVATFGSYQDEHGHTIRYLVSVNYHGADGTLAGTSLAPIVDAEPPPPPPKEEDEEQDGPLTSQKPRQHLGILGVAMGAGLEHTTDIDQVENLFQNLRPGQDPWPIKVLQPNPEFVSMEEETQAFKGLSAEAKEEVTMQHTMGPSKMAHFVYEYAQELMQAVLQKEQEHEQRILALQQQQEQQQQQQQQQEELRRRQQQQQAAQATSRREFDVTKSRFACRKCRTVLFGDDDLEDPPHVPAQHSFSAKKLHRGSGGGGGGGVGQACQSYFLASSSSQEIAWMGDMDANEGRFACPKCQTKLGTWHWAGAQCSCGTWVSPAIQIPKSKVDIIVPMPTPHEQALLPPGTIVSPLIGVPQLQ